MIDFSKLQSLTIPEGVVTQINNGTVVLWSGEKELPLMLEVAKITSNTYASSTSYSNEEFILLDIYPKTSTSTVQVTYGGLTKTLTFNGTNAKQVFFGTFNGVSDSVTTPASGTLTVEGKYSGVAVGSFVKDSKSNTGYCGCVTGVKDLGNTKTVPKYAFRECASLTSANISKGVRSISEGAFYNCTALTSITIPSSVSDIHTANEQSILTTSYSAFYGCVNLTSFIVDEGNNSYSSDGGLLLSKDRKTLYAYPSCAGSCTIPSYVTTIYSGVFYYNASLSSVTIPSSVTSIGAYAFSNSGLTSVTIPSSVTSIGGYTFGNCNKLTSVTLQDGFTNMAPHMFYYCTVLTNVTIPSSVTSISTYAFYYSALTSVTIPSSVTSIGNYAFSNTDLTSVTIPSSVTSIGNNAFADCNLTNVTLQDGLISIGNSAFHTNTNLSSVTIPASVTSIGHNPWYGTHGKTTISVASGNKKFKMDGNCLIDIDANKVIAGNFDFTIPSYITTIGNYAFYGLDMITVTIPSSVTSIGEYAFGSCKELNTVTIPASVTSIKAGAFNGCSGLTVVTMLSPTPPSVDSYYVVFPTTDALTTIMVPKGCGDAYKTATGWSTYFANFIVEAS